MNEAEPDIAVSVIVPTYDRPALLERALLSVAAQEDITKNSIEIIVVDDAGTHSPSQLLQQLDLTQQASIARTELLTHPINAGRSAARNTGIAAARGDYICFLDDDDLLHIQHLRSLLEAAADAPDGAIIHARSELVRESSDGQVLERMVHDDGGTASEQVLLLRNLFPIQAALVPTELLRTIGGFDTALEVLEDWDLWLRLWPHAPFVHLDEVTSEFRHRIGHANSVTHERAQHIVGIQQVYERHPLAGRADEHALRQLREQVLAAAARGLEHAWRYERSVLAFADAASDPELLGNLLSRIAHEQEAQPGAWELVLAAPRTPELQAVLQHVDGDLITLWYPVDQPELATHDVLRRRATGREIVRDESLAAAGIDDH